jgi:putative FmdB family regulatory protein
LALIAESREVAMPIYEYRCSSCGHELEALQKLSDSRLLTCPACGAEALVKKVSAAGFQLKGSGWYATDFKGSGSKPAPKPEGSDSKSDAKDGEKSGAKDGQKSGAKDGEGGAVKSESKGGDGGGESKAEGKSEAKSETKIATPKPASGTGAPPAST